MRQFNLKYFSTSLLFILTVNTFRSFQINNQLVIFIAAALLLVFGVISIHRIRLLCLVLLIVTVYGFLIQRAVFVRTFDNNSKSVHDGVIMTEASYRAFISGVNPYSVNFTGTLIGEKYFDAQIRPTIHYPYSPLMFLTSIPVFLVTERLFGVIDMRITLFIFLFFASWIAASMVKEKILFLIIFLLNPLFLPFLIYGANDVIILFLFLLLVYFLKKKRKLISAVILGLMTGTKLISFVFVPVYFIYILILGKKDRMKNFKKQLAIFLGVNLIIYAPFLLWNSGATLNALLSPWFGVGEELYPIAGFLGIPQILTSLGLVSNTWPFPLFIFAIPLELIFLRFSFRILKENLSPQSFCLLCAFNLFLFLSFSRLVQTYYLAFISQILLLASFVAADKNHLVK